MTDSNTHAPSIRARTCRGDHGLSFPALQGKQLTYGAADDAQHQWQQSMRFFLNKNKNKTLRRAGKPSQSCSREKRFQEVREEREHKHTNAFHPRLVLFFRAMRYLIQNLLPSPPCAVCGARGSSSCAASFIYFKQFVSLCGLLGPTFGMNLQSF